MKKIIIDLDVMSIGLSKGKEERTKVAEEYLTRIKKGGFEIYTPYALVKLARKWRKGEIRKRIIEFYETYSAYIISTKQLYDKVIEKKIDIRTLYREFIALNIKREDILLIVFTSIFELDELITFNKKHLKNNEEKINGVLKKYSLKPIKITLPNSSGTSLESSPFSEKLFGHIFLNFMGKPFVFISHNIKLYSELFKDFVTTSKKTLSSIPLKVTSDENEAITKLTFNQSFSSNTNLTLAFGYLGTVNTRSDAG